MLFPEIISALSEIDKTAFIIDAAHIDITKALSVIQT